MKKYFFIFLSLFFLEKSFSQNTNDTLDIYYLEDQLYFGISYNIVLHKTSINNKIIKNGLFSNGFGVGFIRDIPLNTRRNIGLGVGLGYSQDNIYTNIKVTQNDLGEISASIIETENYNYNKITIHKIDLPIEFRWRTSTAKDEDFFRVYAGGIFSYIFSSYNGYQDSDIDVRYYNNKTANSIQYGVSLLLGYGSWNFYGFYNLTPIFSKNFKIDDTNVKISNLNLGFRYFIL